MDKDSHVSGSAPTLMARSVRYAIGGPAQRFGSVLENGRDPSPRPLDGVPASAWTAHGYHPVDGDGQGFPSVLIIIIRATSEPNCDIPTCTCRYEWANTERPHV